MNNEELTAFLRAHVRKAWVWAIVAAMTLSSFLGEFAVSRAWRHHPVWWLGLFLLLCFLNMGSIVLAGPLAWLRRGREGRAPGIAWGLVRSLALGLILVLLLCLPEQLLHAVHPRPHAVPGYLRILLYSLPGYLAIFSLVGFGIAAYEREFTARAEAERRAQEAQWRLLKGQMNPSVLFNSLNNLMELIRRDPEAAERAVQSLSGLYRRFLAHGEHQLLSLGEERALAEAYLELEGLRLGPRLRVVWDWEPAMDAAMVPPFLLQPLVENAVRHGISPEPAGGLLRISGRLWLGGIRISVENTGRGLEGAGSRGHGLANLEARLRLAFAGDGFLVLESQGPWTRAHLEFPVLEEAN